MKDVKVSEADSNRQIEVSQVVPSEDVEQVHILLKGAMTPAPVNYTVTINYSGPLRADLTGLYIADLGSGSVSAAGGLSR